MCVESQNECGCCADVHFGALLNQTARVIRRALDARISGVNPDLSGVRGMVLGDIVRANRNGRDVYQRDIEQWFNIRRSSVTALLQGMEQDGFITRCAVEKDARLNGLSPPTRAAPVMRKLKPASHSLKVTCRRALTRSRPPSPALCWNKPCATRSTFWKREIPTKRGEISLVKNTRT